MPMHWGSQFMRGPGVNGVTLPAFDPDSRQPELKAAAIEVTRMQLPHRLIAMRRLEVAAAAQLNEALKPLLEAFDYATLTLAGRETPLVVLRGYSAAPVAQEVLDRIDQLLGLDQPQQVMRYVDAAKRVEKAARIDAGHVTAVCLSGETAAGDWIKTMMAGGASTEALRPWILAPVSRPPKGSMNRGPVVCNCFDVALSEIKGDAAAGLDIAAIQARRKCGTSCGSCLPEVKRIILATQAGATQP